jgi:endonuclease III
VDDTVDTQEAFALQEQVEGLVATSLAAATARANTTAVTLGLIRKFATPDSLWQVTTAGTTAAAQPSIAGLEIDDTVTDGTAVFTRIV